MKIKNENTLKSIGQSIFQNVLSVIVLSIQHLLILLILGFVSVIKVLCLMQNLKLFSPKIYI